MLNKEETNKLLDRLRNHSELLESIKDLLDITEGVIEIEKADNVELALIPEVRGLGRKCLQDWAEYQTEKKEGEAKQKKLKQHSKKK